MVSRKPLSPPEAANMGRVSRKSVSISNNLKSTRGLSARVVGGAADAHLNGNVTDHVAPDGRIKRVWKACEKCRMKKTKCDGEFPCKRCKDHGLACMISRRKHVELKQLPQGYAEILEHSQLALIATVGKLYDMVRSSQAWNLSEPGLNNRGQPIIHDIAQILGCIRPNTDTNAQVNSDLPDDEARMTETPQPLKELRCKDVDGQKGAKNTDASQYRNSGDPSFELDCSYFEDYRKVTFASGNDPTLSAQRFITSNDFEFIPEMETSDIFAPPTQSENGFSTWSMPISDTTELAGQYYNPALDMQNMNIADGGIFGTGFGTIKPDILSCLDAGVVNPIGNRLVYLGIDGDALSM